ncbi:MAG: hypothetical protein ACOC7P_00730 [Chloroflexota bacterium]
MSRKETNVKCEFCEGDATRLINLRVYTREGIQVCGKCYEVIASHCHKPYSKVMDKLAMVEAGCHVNRKLATMPGSSWQTRSRR